MSMICPEKLTPVLKRFKKGTLSIKSRNMNIVKVSVAANEIIIDLKNLEIAKEILEPLRKLGILNIGIEEWEENKSVVKKLKILKKFAENLKKENMTINIRRMGEPVLVIGEKAKPRLSKLILGNSIQANITKIISLMKALR